MGCCQLLNKWRDPLTFEGSVHGSVRNVPHVSLFQVDCIVVPPVLNF